MLHRHDVIKIRREFQEILIISKIYRLFKRLKDEKIEETHKCICAQALNKISLACKLSSCTSAAYDIYIFSRQERELVNFQLEKIIRSVYGCITLCRRRRICRKR